MSDTTTAILQIISAAVTPVVMISACGTLSISVNNKQQSLSDRIRAAATESRMPDISPERRSQLLEQIGIFYQRFRLTWAALVALYAAISCFLVTTLLILYTERRMSHSNALTLGLFIGGIALMFVSAFLIVLEAADSNRSLRVEIRDIDLPLRRRPFHARSHNDPMAPVPDTSEETASDIANSP